VGNESKGDRRTVVRVALFRALLVVLPLVVLATAAGAGPDLSSDVWAAVVLAGPVVAVAVSGLVLPVPAVPASALIGRQARGSVWRWYVRPYLPTALAALGVVLAEYAGAALSTRGLRPLLFADDPELGSYFPLIGLGFGLLLGWCAIAMVVVPLKTTARAVTLWSTDRPEAVRLLTFSAVILAILLTVTAHLGVFTGSGEGRLAMLRDELDLLFTPGAMAAPWWSVALAWAGMASLAAAGVAWRWTTQRGR
jgi:hypothetical protein